MYRKKNREIQVEKVKFISPQLINSMRALSTSWRREFIPSLFCLQKLSFNRLGRE